MTNVRQETRTQPEIQAVVSNLVDMMVTNNWGHPALEELAKREAKLTK
jgi:hypothetical protein